MKCTFYGEESNWDYLTITDLFELEHNSGSPFQFYVSRMRNAISMSPETFRVTTFDSVLEVDENGKVALDGIIDQGFVELTAQEG